MSRQEIFRPCQASDAADARCIGRDGNAAGAQNTRRIAQQFQLGQALSDINIDI